MWALRVLSGEKAGQIYVLQEGKNKIGRAETADIRIQESGISKEHLEVSVVGSKVLVSDLNSANGTFLNGVRVRGGVLRPGDKLSIGPVLCDLIPARKRSSASEGLESRSLPEPRSRKKPNSSHVPSFVPPAPLPVPLAPQQSMTSAVAMPLNLPVAGGGPPNVPTLSNPPRVDLRTSQQKVDEYVNSNLLPPLLAATEQFEFRIVLMLLMGLYVVAVTALSVIPMNQITSDSIATESRRRATSVARSVARVNEKVLRSGDIASFSVESALREEGVEDAFVLSKDGHILSPAERVGMVPKEAALLRNSIQAAGNHEVTEHSGGKVIVGVPIQGYDSDLQQNVAKAYTIVVYNPGALSFDDGRVFSLFVQTLTLALLVGAMVYFLIYKIIQYPFVQLNEQLDQAIRENRDRADVKVQLPVLHALVTNINSLLARVHQAGAQSAMTTGEGVRDHEYMNLIQLIGYPALAISSSGKVLKVNSNFEALVGISADSLESRPLDVLTDQSLQGSLKYLMEQSKASSSQIALHTLEFSGHPFVMHCQAMSRASGEVDCYLVSIKPPDSVEGQAA